MEIPNTKINKTERETLQYQILVLGAQKVGKTQLIRRLANKEFTTNYQLNSEPSQTSIQCQRGIFDIKLKIWESNSVKKLKRLGTDKFNPTKIDCVILVYDVSNIQSFEILDKLTFEYLQFFQSRKQRSTSYQNLAAKKYNQQQQMQSLQHFYKNEKQKQIDEILSPFESFNNLNNLAAPGNVQKYESDSPKQQPSTSNNDQSPDAVIVDKINNDVDQQLQQKQQQQLEQSNEQMAKRGINWRSIEHYQRKVSQNQKQFDEKQRKKLIRMQEKQARLERRKKREDEGSDVSSLISSSGSSSYDGVNHMNHYDVYYREENDNLFMAEQQQLQEQSGFVQINIAGNKFDLSKQRDVVENNVQTWMKKYNVAKHTKFSALLNIKVQQVLDEAIDRCLPNKDQLRDFPLKQNRYYFKRKTVQKIKMFLFLMGIVVSYWMIKKFAKILQ